MSVGVIWQQGSSETPVPAAALMSADDGAQLATPDIGNGEEANAYPAIAGIPADDGATDYCFMPV
jgi:hypothetical protein